MDDCAVLADEVTRLTDIVELILNSGLPTLALIEVGNDYRLADREPLEKMLEACVKSMGADAR